MPASVHAVFLDSLTQIDLQKHSLSVTAHFAGQRQGVQTVVRVGTGCG